ncbi:hypothetical protein DW322_02170 [Rhodococcus rhodnii]|uniref:Uncharacterized protein n=2 Tax=Rhodococcus rhodnii TaxID=38312 RepID=R7WSC1_9NOCA|nr:hypothetical protein [Rhodococcus rhodnii]EOM78252.1 hypothetical protein Rrhod_0337 [Rhodococcus rhodnii LMG 5362]TXG89268.1 hypothetical protein DW322_02170 [Rhodococcus rhodnii]
MTLRKSLIRLGVTIAAGYGVVFAIPHLASLGPTAPDDSDMAQLREALAPPSRADATPPPPLPDGFPSMMFPPPEVPVEPGEPQPITVVTGRLDRWA